MVMTGSGVVIFRDIMEAKDIFARLKPIRQALLRCSRIGVKMSFVGSLVLCRKY